MSTVMPQLVGIVADVFRYVCTIGSRKNTRPRIMRCSGARMFVIGWLSR